MTTIYNVSAGFLTTYATYHGKAKLDAEEIFKRLSLEMGGDGSSITKDQLNDYIDKAESGTLDVGKSKLNALKKIQENWDQISNGDDSITFEDMKKYNSLLMATVIGDFSKTEINDSKSSAKDAIYDYLTDYLDLSNKNDIKESDLTDYLNELMTNSTPEDDSNSDLIGTLTNMIATFSTNTTVETEA